MNNESPFPARVQRHHWHNCFAYLHASSQSTPTTIPLNCVRFCPCRVRLNDRELFIQVFFCGERIRLSEGEIELILPDSLIESFHLSTNVQVSVEPCSLSDCVSVEIEPVSANDWDIIESSAGEIEQLFLDQIHVVQEGMRYPLWISPSLIVWFNIVAISPTSRLNAAILMENTEVYVKPIVSSRLPPGQSLSSMSPRTASMSPRRESSRITPDQSDDFNCASFISEDVYPSRVVRLRLRILPQPLWPDDDLFRHFHPTMMVTNDDDGDNTMSIMRLSGSSAQVKGDHLVLHVPCSLLTAQPMLRNSLKFFAIDVEWKSELNFQYRLSHVILSEEYRDQCRFSWSQWIIAERILSNEICVVKRIRVEVENLFLDAELFTYALQKQLSLCCGHYPVILSRDGLRLKIPLSEMVTVSCIITPELDETSDQFKAFIFTCQCFPKMIIIRSESKDSPGLKDSPGSKDSPEQRIAVDEEMQFGAALKTLKNLRDQTDLVANYSRMASHRLLNDNTKSHLLVIGHSKSGKTSILYRIARRLFRGPLAVYSLYIDCRTLSGKTPENVEKRLLSALDRCSTRHPSLLCLDNLDELCCVQSDENQLITKDRLAAVVQQCVSRGKTLVIATCKSLHSLHRSFLKQGKNFFTHQQVIGALNLEGRLDAFQELLGHVDFDLHDAVHATEGCTIGDISRLIKRIRLESNGQSDFSSPRHSGVSITEKHVNKALEDFRTVSQKANAIGVDSQMIDLSCVGGMKSVLDQLTRLVIWPIKYPSLFSTCGVTLGKGVLLHGPPGCGKTLIARALSSLCKMNVINIKGPELLSKYIGASEQNVRDTFEKARASKPCLIFFDEFDALAPRRGHDSTGVTDRVVNQLLTELDGFETLLGVYVIAASNRPGLIDPALLRPGRLDYRILCDFPDSNDREAILRVLSRDMQIDVDVDWTRIAASTDQWTGADLKALLTNAQFLSMRERTGKSVDHR